MRDLRAAAERHRARFVLARRMVPPVGRVLLAARVPGVVYTHGITELSLRLHLSPVIVGVARGLTGERGPSGPVARTVVSRFVDQRAVVAAGHPAVDREIATTTRRLDRVLTRDEHRVTRSEQRVPQVIRVVTSSAPISTTPTLPAAAAGAPCPAVLAPGSGPGTAQAVPLDLGRITDHVLTAMDDRLTAYAERLGRG